MAKLTVQNFRDRLRDVLDVGTGDLTDTVADLFLTQGMRYCQRYNRGLWPFYENTWTFNTVADQKDYAFTAVQANDPNSYKIAQIASVRSDDKKKFTWMSRNDFDRDIARDTTAKGTPRVWSVRDYTTLRLYPTPNDVVAVDVHGHRTPTNWIAIGGGSTSDMPEQFDDVILCYALGKAYAQQDEGQTSLFWLQIATAMLEELETLYDSPPPVDSAMNSRPWGPSWRPETPGRLPFDFEEA